MKFFTLIALLSNIFTLTHSRPRERNFWEKCKLLFLGSKHKDFHRLELREQHNIENFQIVVRTMALPAVVIMLAVPEARQAVFDTINEAVGDPLDLSSLNGEQLKVLELETMTASGHVDWDKILVRNCNSDLSRKQLREQLQHELQSVFHVAHTKEVRDDVTGKASIG